MTGAQRASTFFLGASVTAFLVSLFCPAIAGSDTVIGYHAFVLGPFGLMAGHVGWLANPALVSAWGLTLAGRGGRAADVLAFVALLLGTTCVATLEARGLGYEGVTVSAHVLVGYWVWMSSMVLLLPAPLLRRLAREADEKRRRAEEDERAIRELGL